MSKYIIEGGKKLIGKTTLSGNKNSILPCLAACLLTDEEVILHNVPQISDVAVILEIFENLGVEYEAGEHLIKVKGRVTKKPVLPENLVGKLRASLLLISPLLVRYQKVEFFHPGGDVIGKRSIGVNLEALSKLGFKFKVDDTHYRGWGDFNSAGKTQEIFLEEASITATENLLLAAALKPSPTILKNCAPEPHVVDLCNLLLAMGVSIEGIGNTTLKVQGAKTLHGADFTIGSDHIELATFAIAAAITHGEIEIENCKREDFEPVVYHLERFGLLFEKKNNSLIIKSESITAVCKLHTNIWPGFPTDAMSIAIVLATQAKGITLCHDWMYETRMFFTDKLISMGANITLADPHRVLVYGPVKLYGRNLETPDIRAGMALVLAAMVASGQSIINRAELIERGYENVVEKLTSLGASIQKID